MSRRTQAGVVWIEGSDFAQGTIEVDVRGRDVPGRSFVGVAFHRQDDNTYDAVYLRPSISEPPTLVGASTPCSTSRFPSTTGRRSDNSFQESSRIRSTRPSHRLTGSVSGWSSEIERSRSMSDPSRLLHSRCASLDRPIEA